MEQAVALLDQHRHSIKVLAGGQSLLPIMALRLGPPEQLLDIARLPDLDRIDVDDDGSVTIGALVTHARAEQSDDLARWAPLVHEAMPQIGHRAIRSRGTVVGSLAHADPAAEMPAVALATGATMIAQSTAGVREIPADRFFTGFLDTALQANELLTAVRFPPWPPAARSVVVEVSRRHGDYAMVGLACGLAFVDGVDDVDQASGRVIDDAALSFFGMASTPVRPSKQKSCFWGRF